MSGMCTEIYNSCYGRLYWTSRIFSQGNVNKCTGHMLLKPLQSQSDNLELSVIKNTLVKPSIVLHYYNTYSYFANQA